MAFLPLPPSQVFLIHILQQILAGQLLDVALAPRYHEHQSGTYQTAIEGPACHLLDGYQRGLNLYLSLHTHGSHVLRLGLRLALILHTSYRLVIGLCRLQAGTVVILCKAGYIILLAMLKHIGVERRTDARAMTIRTVSMMQTQVDMKR